MHHLHDVLLSWGPLGVFLFALIESAGIPNPGGTDVFLLVLTIAHADPWLCATLAVIGSLLGSAIFFEITRRGGERVLARYVSAGRGQRFRIWFLRYGLVTVFIPALLPIPFLPFKVFAAFAGALGHSRTRFMLVLAAARIPRYLALAYLGAELGENSLHWVTAHMWYFVAAAIALSLLLFMLIRFTGRPEKSLPQRP
jgi:membrane protein YqaA with SNARE-associated domain